MEHVKIVGLGVVASAAYGIAHDMITAHLCIEYFTRDHPMLVPTESPVLLAVVWGVAATWWMGAFLGLLLAAAARWGRYKPLTARELLPSVVRLFVFVGVCAFVAGALGYWISHLGGFHRYHFNPEWATADKTPRYWAVAAAHTTSYVVGAISGVGLAIKTWLQRKHRGANS